MYIKKSVLTKIVLSLGAFALVLLMVMYSFTETKIPGILYILAWGGSIFLTLRGVSKIERHA